MAQGTERRVETDDTLAAKQAVEPVRLSGPGISAPQMPNLDLGAMSKLSRALGKWASERIQAEANKEQETALMDGAMASVQGQTMDQLEMDGGDKFALQGWRITTAQTISAGVLAAQKQEIIDADYALDPEQFRQKYVAGMAQAIDGQDARTGRMINETMLAQMPELVAQHTIANTAFNERNTFTAVKQAIALMSRDATSLGPLIQIATGGEGTQSAALSADRQSSATTEGIVLAFTQMNPRAYDLLKTSGVLDNYSTEQINRIEAAKTQYQGKLRTELNRTRDDELFALEARIATGEVSGTDAVDELIAINSRHGIETDSNDSQAMFSATVDPNRTAGKTRAIVMQGNIDRKEWGALAASTMGILRKVESLDNPLAVGPLIEHGENKGDRAQGAEQIMPRTLKQPGFGITPSDGTPDDNIRVAEEYWAMLVLGSEQKAGKFPWAPGDLEAAAIGYNAGWVNAKKWINADRDYNVLPDKKQSKEYWARWTKELDDQEFPMAGDRYNEAVHQAKLTKKALALAAWEDMAPLLADLDDKYSQGVIGPEEWKRDRLEITSAFKGMRTEAMINYEIQFTKDLISTTRKASGKRLDAMKADALATAMIGIDAQFTDVIKNPESTDEEKVAAMEVYRAARNEALDVLNIDVVEAKSGKWLTGVYKRVQESMATSDKWNKEEAEIGRQTTFGTVSELKPALQRRAYAAETKLFMQEINDQFEVNSADPALDAEKVRTDAIANAKLHMYKRLGQVDPEVKAAESAIALGNFINSDGTPNQKMVEMITRYEAMKLVSPEIAKGYLTDGARRRVNAVVSLATDDAQYGQAMKDLTMPRTTKEESNLFVRSARIQALVTEVVTDFAEWNDTSGWLQAQALTSDADAFDSLWQLDPERARAASQETRTDMINAVSRRVMQLHRVDSGLTPERLVQTAWEDVKAKSGLVGGAFIMQKEDVLNTMFGAKAAQYAKPNVMHLAVVALLRTQAMKDQYRFIDQFGPAELLPESWQDAISGSLFGWVGDFGQGVSLNERFWAGRREVRSFEGFTDASGQLYARMILPDGNYSTGIPISLKDAGAALMAENPLF